MIQSSVAAGANRRWLLFMIKSNDSNMNSICNPSQIAIVKDILVLDLAELEIIL